MENTANEISSNIKLENEENISCQESSKSLENQIDIDDLKNRENKTIKQQNVEKTIQKWIKLQKTIKEEITLEEVIIKQQKDDFKYLKDLFFQYYETKIKSRKQFYIIRKLEKNMKVDNPEFIVEKNGESILLTSNETIKNLLFLIRNNYDYITKIVSLIEETDEPENIDSLVELFCNQFYDNILIPNPEQEELLILIYKLLEEEITPMNSASIDEFLSDTTFIGKFISSYMNKRALKVFLAMLVNPLILSIENSGMECMDMSLKNINREVNKKRNDNQNSEINFDNWLDDIPKSTIHFKKYYVLDNDEENEEKEKNEMKVERSISMRSESIDITSEEIEKNLEYKDELTLDKIKL